MRIAWMLLVALLLCPTSTIAQSIDSLVRRAVEAHPSIEALRLAVRQIDARANVEEAWDAPTVGLQFSELSPSNPNPLSKGETMVMMEQTFPLFGQKKAMARAMRIGSEVGEAKLDDLRRDLRLRVEQEYYLLWLFDRRAEVNTENRRIAELLYKAIEVQYATSTGRGSDLLRIRSEAERLENEAREIAEERAGELARMNALLLRPSGQPIRIDERFAVRDLPALDSLEALVTGHPQLREMEAMARMSDAQAEAETTMLEPMLMLRGGVGYMPEGHPLREGNFSAEMGVMDTMHFTFTIGAMISIPIAPWSGAGPRQRAESYRIEAASKLRDRDAMHLEMLSMLRSACSNARRANLRLTYYHDTQLPLLERTLDALRAEYLGGRTPFNAVMDGYQMLAMARMDAYMQQMQYTMSLSMISQLTGWAYVVEQ